MNTVLIYTLKINGESESGFEGVGFIEEVQIQIQVYNWHADDGDYLNRDKNNLIL